MQASTVFRTYLEERNAQLQKEHIDLKNQEQVCREQQEDEVIVMGVNSSAATAWDFHCEYDRLIKLYDLEHGAEVNMPARAIENAAHYVQLCVKSCTTIDQLETAAKMVMQLSEVFGNDTQVTGWQASLTLQIFSKKQNIFS